MMAAAVVQCNVAQDSKCDISTRQGAFMRKTFAILIAVLAVSAAGAQSGSTTQAAPAAQSGAAAKPRGTATSAVHTATKPTGLINTSGGNVALTLVPDKAPVG